MISAEKSIVLLVAGDTREGFKMGLFIGCALVTVSQEDSVAPNLLVKKCSVKPLSIFTTDYVFMKT